MDFEIADWKSSKKANDLSDKLFGQNYVKVKKSEVSQPLSGALAREESTKAKKRIKKEKFLVSKPTVVKAKPKTREEAIALAKARKHQKRKLQQKLVRYKAKVQAQADIGDSPSQTSVSKLKKSVKQKKLSKDGQVKLTVKKGNKEKAVDEPSPTEDKVKKNKRNKYKHLAQQEKAEMSALKVDRESEDKTFEADSDLNGNVKDKIKKSSTHKVNGKTKCQTFSDSSDDDIVQSKEDKSCSLKKKGAAKEASAGGANDVTKKQKKKKLLDCSLIEADDKKVEVVDLQETAKKRKKAVNVDVDSPAQPPPKKKKRKRQESNDLVNISLTNKRPIKDKFNMQKLNTLLSKDTSRKAKQTEEASASPESDSTKSLKSKMEAQLNSARFRFINEQLYTTSSEEAVAMMKEDPEAFNVYHQGFQTQVSKWPTNPQSLMVSYLKKRSKSLVVADLGCGDGTLAESVKQEVYSFDLVANKEGIIACDIADLPLEDNAVDVSIFCLSLMGTNLVDFITEANRVTKQGGKLLIAEVLSRFEKLSNFNRKMAKLGFKLLNKDESNKMFVWMEYEKTGAPDYERLPQLDLTPCTYKKR